MASLEGVKGGIDVAYDMISERLIKRLNLCHTGNSECLVIKETPGCSIQHMSCVVKAVIEFVRKWYAKFENKIFYITHIESGRYPTITITYRLIYDGERFYESDDC